MLPDGKSGDTVTRDLSLLPLLVEFENLKWGFGVSLDIFVSLVAEDVAELELRLVG